VPHPAFRLAASLSLPSPTSTSSASTALKLPDFFVPAPYISRAFISPASSSSARGVPSAGRNQGLSHTLRHRCRVPLHRHSQRPAPASSQALVSAPGPPTSPAAAATSATAALGPLGIAPWALVLAHAVARGGGGGGCAGAGSGVPAPWVSAVRLCIGRLAALLDLPPVTLATVSSNAIVALSDGAVASPGTECVRRRQLRATRAAMPALTGSLAEAVALAAVLRALVLSDGRRPTRIDGDERNREGWLRMGAPWVAEMVGGSSAVAEVVALVGAVEHALRRSGRDSIEGAAARVVDKHRRRQREQHTVGGAVSAAGSGRNNKGSEWAAAAGAFEGDSEETGNAGIPQGISSSEEGGSDIGDSASETSPTCSLAALGNLCPSVAAPAVAHLSRSPCCITTPAPLGRPGTLPAASLAVSPPLLLRVDGANGYTALMPGPLRAGPAVHWRTLPGLPSERDSVAAAARPANTPAEGKEHHLEGRYDRSGTAHALPQRRRRRPTCLPGAWVRGGTRYSPGRS